MDLIALSSTAEFSESSFDHDPAVQPSAFEANPDAMDTDASDREAQRFGRTRTNQRNRLLFAFGSVGILAAPGYG